MQHGGAIYLKIWDMYSYVTIYNADSSKHWVSRLQIFSNLMLSCSCYFLICQLFISSFAWHHLLSMHGSWATNSQHHLLVLPIATSLTLALWALLIPILSQISPCGMYLLLVYIVRLCKVYCNLKSFASSWQESPRINEYLIINRVLYIFNEAWWNFMSNYHLP